MKKKNITLKEPVNLPENFIKGTDPVAVNLLRQIYSTLKDKIYLLDTPEKYWIDGVEKTYSDKKIYEVSHMDELLNQAQDILNNSQPWSSNKKQFYILLEKLIFLKAREEVFKDFFNNVEDVVKAAMQLDFTKRVPFNDVVTEEKRSMFNYSALMLNMLMETMANSVVSMKGVNAILSDKPGVIIIITDRIGNIRFVSDTGEKFLGVEHNALTGSPIKNIIHNFSEVNNELTKEGEVRDFKIDIALRGLHEDKVSANLSIPKLYKNGTEVDEIVYTIKLQDNEEEKESTNLINELHDRVSPVNSILGAMNILKNRFIDSDSQRLLSIVNKCALKLRDDSTTQLKQMTTPTVEDPFEPISIPLLIDEIIESLSLNEGFQELEIKKEIRDVDFFGQRKLFYSVVQNLLSNAIKYRKKDIYNVVSIQFTQTYPGRFLLEIKDNGIGIKRDELGKIFEKGYRASEDICDGNGLGLLIVRDAVHKMKGEITVSSVVGKGTVFSIYLPDILHS